MDMEFVRRFERKKFDIREKLRSRGVPTLFYDDIVKAVIEGISDDYGDPDPENIHRINDGDYQGTLLFIIPEKCYQPHTYWYVKVWYGSCSWCDTLQAIQDGCGSDDEKLDDIMTLALHIVQGIKKMEG